MKNIVFCFDGSWFTESMFQSNVTKIYGRLESSDQQISFYDGGKKSVPILERLTGGFSGIGLTTRIEDAYDFLVHNYNPGDKVFLIGAARGAFLAGTFANLLDRCGLLEPGTSGLIPHAMSLYFNKNVDPKMLQGFRKTFSTHCEIESIGLWETVGSQGIPMIGGMSMIRIDDAQIPAIVKTMHHAIAIDERRKIYEHFLWQSQPNQFLEQVWFSGTHSDITGGYEETGLSDITLEWMMQKLQSDGLLFDRLPQLHPDPHAPIHESFVGFNKFLRPHSRQISGLIHNSVMARYHDDADYRPKNLVRYLETNKDSVA